MALLAYNDILTKTIINYNGEPYEVLSAHIFRMQQRKPVNQTRLRHVVTGKVIEISFHQNETVSEAEVDTMKAKYLYTNRGESWFVEDRNPKKRFSFPEMAVHDNVQWLMPNVPVDVVTHNEKPVAIRIPVKVDLAVTEAPPSVRGNTATGGNKLVTLATGAQVQAPLFINVGDVVRINTDTGEYTERVEKA